MENEQAILDDHDDKLSDLFDLLALFVTLEELQVKVRVDLQQHLHRRLQYVVQNLQRLSQVLLINHMRIAAF